MLKSTNSGLNLFTCYSDNFFLQGVSFINSNTGFVGGQQRILKTTNCGESWSVFSVPNLETHIINYVCARTNNSIFATTYHSDIMSSFNGGLNWNNFTKSISGNHLTDIIFLDSLNGLIAGANKIMKSTNGGFDWFSVFSTYKSFYRLSFYGNNYGYCIDNNYMSKSFYKTTNTGLSWVSKNLTNYALDKLCVYALDENTVFIATNDADQSHYIYKSTNGGDNFYSVFTNSNFITDITFLDSNVGFAVNSQNLLKTSNRGESWYYPMNIFPVRYSRIKFINQNTGFLTGSTVLKTSNSGYNWNEVIPYSYSNNIRYSSISFANDSLGLIIGTNYSALPESSFVLTTLNGGNNWI